MHPAEYTLDSNMRVGDSIPALCSDGVTRMVRITGEADTWFSMPARVTVKGKTVSGYVSVSTVQGYDVPTDDDPAVVRFRAYTYRKNADMLPERFSTDLP